MKKFFLLVLIGLQFLIAGCIEFYSYRDYEVKVIDQESGKTIEGAKVTIDYYRTMKPVLNPPKKCIYTTNIDGNVKARVADYNISTWYVEADGFVDIYSLSDYFFNEETNEFVFPLYKEPEPVIEIVVPSGYRGPVAIEYVKADKMLQDKTDGRVFTFYANEKGYVAIQGSLKCIRKQYPEITVKYENGTQIEYEPENPDIDGLWRVTGGTNRYRILFVVGTDNDCRNFKNRFLVEWTEIVNRRERDFITFNDNEFNSYFENK